MADGAVFENIGSAITHLPVKQFERNMGGRTESSPWHVRHDADLDETWAVASHRLHDVAAIMQLPW